MINVHEINDKKLFEDLLLIENKYLIRTFKRNYLVAYFNFFSFLLNFIFYEIGDELINFYPLIPLALCICYFCWVIKNNKKTLKKNMLTIGSLHVGSGNLVIWQKEKSKWL